MTISVSAATDKTGRPRGGTTRDRLLPGQRTLSSIGASTNGQELATAVAEGVAPVIVVVNNARYGTIREHQEKRHPGRVSGTALVNPDFAALARAFGGYGEVVESTDQAPAAFDRAFAAGVPAVVELRVPQN